jgi:hypothetical protein
MIPFAGFNWYNSFYFHLIPNICSTSYYCFICFQLGFFKTWHDIFLCCLLESKSDYSLMRYQYFINYLSSLFLNEFNFRKEIFSRAIQSLSFIFIDLIWYLLSKFQVLIQIEFNYAARISWKNPFGINPDHKMIFFKKKFLEFYFL